MAFPEQRPMSSGTGDETAASEPSPDNSSDHASAAAAAPSLPSGLGRFTALRFHAKGGLGEVFVARDEELQREVALKRIQEVRAGDPDCRRRFLIEAEVTARLEHPGVVPVHGLVTDGAGQPAYVMRFIAVCNTIAYAHSRGILHRDLKPANIMLGNTAKPSSSIGAWPGRSNAPTPNAP